MFEGIVEERSVAFSCVCVGDLDKELFQRLCRLG